MGVAVAIVLAIGLVVLVIVGDEVVEREAVMGGDKIHRRPRLATALVEQVRRGRQPRREFGELALIALPERPHRVAEAVIPLRPARREPADLVAARAAIPGLGDQLDLAQYRVLAAGIEEAAALIKAIGLARQNGGEVEAEAIDPHILRPIAQAVGDHLQHPLM